MLRESSDGARYFKNALNSESLERLSSYADTVLTEPAGARLFDNRLGWLLATDGPAGGLAGKLAAGAVQPVRAVIFNKTSDNNWSTAWHQDRTIPVKERCDVPGFSTWSKKSNIWHVEPPFDLLAGMLTLKIFIDDCGVDQGPVKIAKGSHRLGRVRATGAGKFAKGCEQISCTAERGDMWALSTPILHASDASRVNKPRRILHVDYSPDLLPAPLQWLPLV